MLRRICLGCLVGFGVFCVAYVSGNAPHDVKPPVEEPLSVRELAELLKQKLDPADFDKMMSLKEFIATFKRHLGAAGKNVPILVSWKGFREENPDVYPDADALLNTEIPSIIDPELKHVRMTAASVLGSGLAKLPTNDATFIVNPGHLQVTTLERGSVQNRLGQRINVRFNRRALADALEDLYELTGVSVILDSRAGRVAQMPLTATFTYDTSLGSALLLLSEMAGLKLVAGDNIVYITTPVHAQQFLLERRWNPYGLPALQGSGYGREKRVEAAE